MIKINIKENLINALTINEIEWIPCTAFSAVPITKIIEKLNISFESGQKNSKDMATIASLGYEYAGLEGIPLPFDLCFEAEAMGCEVELKNKNGPSRVIETPFNELSDVEMNDDFIHSGRFPIMEEAIHILHDEYDDKNIPIIGSITGPLTLLGQIFPTGTEGIIKHTNDRYIEVEEALEQLTNCLIEEIQLYEELEVDVIAIYEPNSTPSLLDPSIFKQLLMPFLEDLSRTMDIPGVLHVCGDTTTNLENMFSCGFEGISISEDININEAKQLQAELNTPTRLCGNISTNQTLFSKSPKEVMKESLNALSQGIDILSPSCMIAPNTPLKNVKAMVHARNEFCDLEI